MSDIPIAEDFAAIAAGLKRLESKSAASSRPWWRDRQWWCEDCGKDVPGDCVTFGERHDEYLGGCGCNVYLSCDRCENGGWVMAGYQECPPQFEICPECYNPSNRPSP